MRYLVLFMQTSLRWSNFRSAGIYEEFKRFVLQYFCNFNSPKNLHLPVGQVNHRIHQPGPIAKSTSPGLSDTTFFARWFTFKWRVEPLGVKRFVAKRISIGYNIECVESVYRGQTWQNRQQWRKQLNESFFPFKALHDLFTTELNLCQWSVVMGFKSEGRRTIRFRMGYDTSSKQHSISWWKFWRQMSIGSLRNHDDDGNKKVTNLHIW